jgi:cold shock CspA family protein
MKTGQVVAFDEAVGLGTVRADDGTVLPFHCTAIAGGTRTIDVGTRVVFDVTAGGRGQWEAGSLVALG